MDPPSTRSKASVSEGSAKDLDRLNRELRPKGDKIPPSALTKVTETKVTPLDDPKLGTSSEKDDIPLKIPKIQIHRLQMGIDQLIHISDQTLEEYSLSKYHEGNYYPLEEVPVPSPPRANIPDERVSNASDKTEIYWPLDQPGNNGNKNDTPKKGNSAL